MTISPQLIGNCPPWDDEIPRGKEAIFAAIVKGVAEGLRSAPRSEIVSAATPRDWHRVVFQQFVPLEYYAGNYRCSDSRYPCLNRNVQVNGVVGSDFELVAQDIELLFSDFKRQLATLEVQWSMYSPNDRALSLALVTANLVGQFIRIHPFLNGNGRMSRLLWGWCLLRFGVPKQFGVHPRPDQPYSQLMREAMIGNTNPLALAILRHLALNAPERK